MDDTQIIALYEQRDEQALRATEQKYGVYCQTIARNLLGFEDAEECVSDTWLTAWKRIPPTKPQSLRAFLGRITRTLAISRWRGLHARKRGSDMTLLLSELDECLPAPGDVEQTLAAKELSGLLSAWLRSLAGEERVLFLRRYWYGVSVKQLAEETECTENQMAQRMRKLRAMLRKRLEQEEIYI